jgi:hypothetical protein
MSSAAISLAALANEQYKALCSIGGEMRECSITLTSERLIATSMDGFSEIALCDASSKQLYRSNPASPYIKNTSVAQSISKSIELEQGVDMDIIFKSKAKQDERQRYILVRFKNKSVARKFARELEQVKASPKCLSQN